MIYLLWPTIRPFMMKESHDIWMERSNNRSRITTIVAVNTENEKDQLNEFEVLVVGSERRGVTHAAYQLSKNLQADQNDIVILASDDMLPPRGWDDIVIKELNGKVAALFVHDDYIIQDCMTIPIMTFSCLERLNKIIYHPSYLHQYSDTELLHNLIDLDLLIDKRHSGYTFTHKHWACNKRQSDEQDHYYARIVDVDANNWSVRCKMNVEERLIV